MDVFNLWCVIYPTCTLQMDKFLRGDGYHSATKRQKMTLTFRDVVGSNVSESVLLECLEKSKYDLEKAIDMYFSGGYFGRISENSSAALDVSKECPSVLPKTKLATSMFLGRISCRGSLTTKLFASANELYMETPLCCTYTIRPVPGQDSAKTRDVSSLHDILHGSCFARFSLSRSSSDLGRLPAPLASCLVPLVRLGLAEFNVSVGFPGCAGQTLNPGASVPINVEVFACGSSNAFATTAEHDLVLERINACWAKVFEEMKIEAIDGIKDQKSVSDDYAEEMGELSIDQGVDDHQSVDKSVDEYCDELQSEDTSAEISAEMTSLVSSELYAHSKGLRVVFSEGTHTSALFPTTLKLYQQQALYWMLVRELDEPKILFDAIESFNQTESAGDQGTSPKTPPITVQTYDGTIVHTDTCSDPAVMTTLPPGWTELTTPSNEVLYYHEGAFHTERPSAGKNAAKGGILADEMGLGKTVMTLSLILFGKFVMTNSASLPSALLPPGGTLVVLHLSLLRQWVKELKRHAPLLSYLEFHGTDRSSLSLSQLASADVVFTTYGTVPIMPDTSPLMKIKWHRMVLDEAHTIRTRATKMAKAVAKLAAEKRWCLTGTPLQNSVEDVYPLIAWLRVHPWRSYAVFKKAVYGSTVAAPNQPSVDIGKLQSILRPIMLRRTKSLKQANGAPLVDLPLRRNKIVYLELGPEEKDFYTALFWETKLQFDKFEKSNSVMYHMTHILQLVMRLRQALCHPAICRVAASGTDIPGDPSSNGAKSLDELLALFMGRNSGDGATKPTANKEYISQVIEELRSSGVSHMECPVCLVEPCQFPVITPCGHTLCRKCCVSRLRQECPICRHVFQNTEIQHIGQLSDLGLQSRESPLVAAESLVCPPLSSKLRALLDYVARDMRRGRRVIVFSQFVAFLDVVSKVFRAKNIPHRMLHGGHTPAQREAAVEWLSREVCDEERTAEASWIDHIAPNHIVPSEDEECASCHPANGRVLLVSLKAGGVGLNLVAANVVYLTDLWWNPAVEEQAFQRVHRLGQTQKVLTYKFVCKDTIDVRIMDLQATKSDMTEDVLGGAADSEERPNRSSKKLSLEDIRQLFKPGRGE